MITFKQYNAITAKQILEKCEKDHSVIALVLTIRKNQSVDVIHSCEIVPPELLIKSISEYIETFVENKDKLREQFAEIFNKKNN